MSQAILLLNVFSLVANISVDSDVPFALHFRMKNNLLSLDVVENGIVSPGQTCNNNLSSSLFSSSSNNIMAVTPPPPQCSMGIWNNTYPGTSSVVAATTCDFQINYCDSQYTGYDATVDGQACQPFPTAMTPYSVTIWNGFVGPFYNGDGDYNFKIAVDDDASLMINNTVVIAASNRYASVGWITGSIYLHGNDTYPFVLTYYNTGGGGAVVFAYNPPSYPNFIQLVNITRN